MNLKQMRNIHLYLGCFFAPLLVLFIASGCWQTFDWHHASKKAGGYKPLAVVRLISGVHTDQCWGNKDSGAKASESFKYLIVGMSIGLLITTLLGVVMAFKYVPAHMVWLCLVGGFLIPALMLWAGR